jgi:hypothetical protein
MERDSQLKRWARPQYLCHLFFDRRGPPMENMCVWHHLRMTKGSNNVLVDESRTQEPNV